MVAYRITARSLERQVVGEHVLKEVASLEDCSSVDEPTLAGGRSPSKVVFILEEEDNPRSGAPRRPE